MMPFQIFGKKILLIICYLLSVFLANNSLLAAEEIGHDCDKVLDNKSIAIEAQALSQKTLLHKAEAYQHSGQYKRSIQALCFALQKASEEKAFYATLLGSLGYAYFMLGKTEKAVMLLEQSINKANQLKQPAIAAVVLNNLGNVCATYRQDKINKRFPHFRRLCAPAQSKNKHNNAPTYYRQSTELAIQEKNNLLAVKASLNLVQTAIDNLPKNSPNNFHTIKQTLFNLVEWTQNLELSPEKIQALLRLGRLIILTNRRFSTAEPNTLQDKAYDVLKVAQHLAQKTNDMASVSQALGYMGQIYQHEKRPQEALTLTRQAIFFAQGLPELRYYWQWQTASILQEQGEHAKAALAYKQAIDTLWSIRYDLSKIYRTFRSSFREQVSALFFEFTELLLTHTSTFSSKEKQEICRLHEQPVDCLKKLQDTLEKLKAAELLDYFQNECVIKNQMSLTEVKLEKGTAVLYPIMLEDRLELLLHKADGMTLIPVTETNRHKLETEAYQLRYELDHDYWSDNFKKHAQNLYHWLIHPLKETNLLQDIKTLVWVPDGQLRTMPIAALHDGKDYLINHYALAVIPGLTLRMIPEQELTNQSTLLAGLDLEQAVNVRGYTLNALNTTDEVEGIKKHISKTVELLNKEFTETHLKEKLIETSYSTVHISSHAVFEADIKNSFILMGEACPLDLEPFEDLLTLNRIHNTPLSLITLSACETALGDDRAALGLGGVALRAGAQSAVATLWKVNPDFTAQFMPIFYEKISKGLSTAKALQETQQAMITSDYYQHPYFWSSFVLIGNWLKF